MEVELTNQLKSKLIIFFFQETQFFLKRALFIGVSFIRSILYKNFIPLFLRASSMDVYFSASLPKCVYMITSSQTALILLSSSDQDKLFTMEVISIYLQSHTCFQSLIYRSNYNQILFC